MGIYSIRRTRLDELIRLQFSGVKAKFAAKMEWPASDVSRFFTKGKHGRNITEKKAREIERQLKLSAYWMDQDDPTRLGAQQPPPVYRVDQNMQDKLLHLFDGLTDLQQNDIIARIESYHKTNQAVLKQLGGATSRGQPAGKPRKPVSA